MLGENQEMRPGRRKVLETLAWVGGVAVLWSADLMTKFAEKQQTGVGKPDIRLFVEQITSAAAALIMILFVVYWLRLFPLRRDAWVPAVIGHACGSVIFGFGHILQQVYQTFC